MKKKIFLLIAVALCCSALAFPQQKEMNMQDAVYKAIQLDNTINGKKTELEKDKVRNFKKFEDEYKAESDKLGKLKKDEFETTNEFNSRIEGERIKLSAALQAKKDNYLQTVYNVQKDNEIAKLENELAELTAKNYKLSDSYYKIVVNNYDADGGFFNIAFNYYVRTVVDPKTQKKVPVFDKIPLKWEIEREKAKEISKRKDGLILDCAASIFKVGGNYVFDKYEISIVDPDTKDVLYNSVFFQNKKLGEQQAVKTPSGGVFVLSIDASSRLTEKRDKNMYQPVKVFDGKPDTGWAESAAGSGIGEWIEIKFAKPVTADKLVVSPGWFDKRYWFLNNRIKTLAVELDDFKKAAEFKDQMVPQEMSLSGAKTFSRAKFIIRDVYRTSKDDDTCIAEIDFRNGKTKIDLDLSACADQMKVVPE